jgi:hypothetical protein
MISALGRGGTGVTVIDNVAGCAGIGGCGIALFFKWGVDSDAFTAFGRAVPRTSASAIPISRMLAT